MRAPGPEAELRRAFDAAAAPVRLWWRDDDAGRDHPRLEALLALARRRAAPVALGVVPDWIEPACAARIVACPQADVLQHGIAHANRAAPGAKKIELGGSADLAATGRMLLAARGRLSQAFGGRALPVLVPPWNRIAAGLIPALPELGFVGLSTFGARPAVSRPSAFVRINTHLDLIRWRERGRPLEFAAAADGLARLVRAAAPEPIGILSHHLAMDEAAFVTLDRLLGVVQDHPKARLGRVRDLIDEEA